MSRSEKWRTFSADFETTVEENTRKQTATEVWSAASVELWTEDVMVFHSIGELYEYYVSLNENIVVYFHNLKFDGNFWLSYLLYDLKFKQAFDPAPDQKGGKFKKNAAKAVPATCKHASPRPSVMPLRHACNCCKRSSNPTCCSTPWPTCAR